MSAAPELVLDVFHERDLAADPARLPPGERLIHGRLGGPRRKEWLRGRAALRRSLRPRLGAAVDQVSLLEFPDGAPRPVGGLPLAISLSHDPPWYAALWREGRGAVAVDLCLRANAARLEAMLPRVAVSAGVELCAAWAAVECALKLRRLSVMELLPWSGRAVEVAPRRDGLEVRGLGAPARCHLRQADEYVLAWADEPHDPSSDGEDHA